MKADIFDGILDTVWNKVLDGVATFSDYAFVGELWVGVVVLVLATGVVAIYLPWQWVKSALGFVALGAALFAAGAQVMFNRMRGETKASQERNRAAEQKKRDDERHGSWF